METTIQITVQKTGKQGVPEMAKAYNTAFEGDLNDLKRLQTDIDAAIEKILWDKQGVKPSGIKNEQAV